MINIDFFKTEITRVTMPDDIMALAAATFPDDTGGWVDNLISVRNALTPESRAIIEQWKERQ